MKLEQLRKIIREEVRTGIKEELQEVITEAIKIASTPTEEKKDNFTPVAQKDLTETWSAVKSNQGTVPLSEMLNQTKASMTSEEYRNVVNANSNMVSKPNFASSMASSMGISESNRPMPGLDISQFDFVKKAGDVYKKSVEKDKAKFGN